MQLFIFGQSFCKKHQCFIYHLNFFCLDVLIIAMLINMNTISLFRMKRYWTPQLGNAYFSEVCRVNAVVAVGLIFMAFSVLDFDVEQGLLKVVTNMLLCILC